MITFQIERNHKINSMRIRFYSTHNCYWECSRYEERDKKAWITIRAITQMKKYLQSSHQGQMSKMPKTAPLILSKMITNKVKDKDKERYKGNINIKNNSTSNITKTDGHHNWHWIWIIYKFVTGSAHLMIRFINAMRVFWMRSECRIKIRRKGWK